MTCRLFQETSCAWYVAPCRAFCLDLYFATCWMQRCKAESVRPPNKPFCNLGSLGRPEELWRCWLAIQKARQALQMWGRLLHWCGKDGILKLQTTIYPWVDCTSHRNQIQTFQWRIWRSRAGRCQEACHRMWYSVHVLHLLQQAMQMIKCSLYSSLQWILPHTWHALWRGWRAWPTHTTQGDWFNSSTGAVCTRGNVAHWRLRKFSARIPCLTGALSVEASMSIWQVRSHMSHMSHMSHISLYITRRSLAPRKAWPNHRSLIRHLQIRAWRSLPTWIMALLGDAEIGALGWWSVCDSLGWPVIPICRLPLQTPFQLLALELQLRFAFQCHFRAGSSRVGLLLQLSYFTSHEFNTFYRHFID